MYNYFKKEIPDTERNRIRLEYVRQEAEKMLLEPIQSLSFSKYRMFHEVGDRFEYENDSQQHRKRMCYMAVMALSSDEPKWMAALEDILWAVCDEATWAFPAHIAKDASLEQIVTTFDLFAAEIAGALSEICYLLGERLHPVLYERIQTELKRRVLTPWLKKRFTYKSNWSAVCACGLCSTIIHCGTKEDFEMAKETLIQSAYDFLESYRQDGCCLEGPLYWSYGFSNFCFLAQMIREQTNGEVDLFKEEKVKNIVLYMQKTCLEDDYILPFGDASHRYRFEYCLVNLLNHEYSEFKAPKPEMLALHIYSDKRERFARFIRDFYWTEEVLPAKEEEVGEDSSLEVFEESQQYIHRKRQFIFAAKGGNNAEPHNHNDIGSFIIFSKGRYLLDDLGWSEYDNKYFTAARYENICASSRGHSVPIINGKEQLPGVQCKAKASYDSESISLDMTLAYDEVDAVTRNFLLKDDAVEIEDYFSGDNLQITERFVTRIQPKVCAQGIRIGELLLQSDDLCDVQLSSQEFHPRALGDLNPTETAYFIDFIFEKVEKEQHIKIKISYEA